MIMNSGSIDEISALITERLSAGFKPDPDTLHFLSTSYGVQGGTELMHFLEDESLNDGTIYELAVYPDDEFRFKLEKIMPPEGLHSAEIENLCKTEIDISPEISIITSAGKFIIDAESKASCISAFIRKLSLDINLQYAGDPASSDSPDTYYAARALLRRRRFIPSGDRGDFMNRLLCRLDPAKTGPDIILKYIDRTVDFLGGKEDKSLDALAVKKYYYESVIAQSEEFASMLKIYSMEFLMMKRISPPSVSVDDALESIRTIDRLTSIAYGNIIPSSDIAVQMKISSEDSVEDIFM